MGSTEFLFDASAAERRAMIETQIRKRGVRSPRVLEAMAAVPRHEFVPEQFRNDAYADKPLPIGEGQTISQPYMVAAMTEALELTGGERVLEIGTGSGYQAAVLSLTRERSTHRGEPHVAGDCRAGAAYRPGLHERARSQRGRLGGISRGRALRRDSGDRRRPGNSTRIRAASSVKEDASSFPWAIGTIRSWCGRAWIRAN